MLLLNLALATFGLAGTLAAFGGETWEKGTGPILQRVTRRGWVALACLVIAFILGGIKEVALYRQAERDERIKEALQKKNDEQQKQIESQLRQIAELQASIGKSATGLAEAAQKIGKDQI